MKYWSREGGVASLRVIGKEVWPMRLSVPKKVMWPLNLSVLLKRGVAFDPVSPRKGNTVSEPVIGRRGGIALLAETLFSTCLHNVKLYPASNYIKLLNALNVSLFHQITDLYHFHAFSKK